MMTLAAGLLIGSVALGATSAGASCQPYTSDCTTVANTQTASTPATTDPQSRASSPLPAPAPAATATTASGGLAFTGADVAATVVVGLALIGAGVVVVLISRRRRLA